MSRAFEAIWLKRQTGWVKIMLEVEDTLGTSKYNARLQAQTLQFPNHKMTSDFLRNPAPRNTFLNLRQIYFQIQNKLNFKFEFFSSSNLRQIHFQIENKYNFKFEKFIFKFETNTTSGCRQRPCSFRGMRRGLTLSVAEPSPWNTFLNLRQIFFKI